MSINYQKSALLLAEIILVLFLAVLCWLGSAGNAGATACDQVFSQQCYDRFGDPGAGLHWETKECPPGGPPLEPITEPLKCGGCDYRYCDRPECSYDIHDIYYESCFIYCMAVYDGKSFWQAGSIVYSSNYYCDPAANCLECTQSDWRGQWVCTDNPPLGDAYCAPPVPPPNDPPIGYHEAANCAAISGWTCDSSDYNQAIDVHFYRDGQAGSGTFTGAVTANQPREAGVGAMCGGNSNHGFVFNTPDFLKDGQPHNIYAYAINYPPDSNPILKNLSYEDYNTLGPCYPAPAADIDANGSDGPISIPYSAAATISWTSTNSTSCTVSPTGWTGTSGSQSTGNLTSSQTYTLNCTGPGGTASDSVTVNVAANSSPNTPTQVVPPNNVWINYNPIFQAAVSDPDTDNVKALFDITTAGHADFWGSLVASGGTSQAGPITDFSDGTHKWRAQAYDAYNAYSSPTAEWTLLLDKTKPSATVSYPTGVTNNTSFTVSLTESDAASGIKEGDVDLSINGGAWSDAGLPGSPAGKTTSDFTYAGIAGSTYKFRYHVQDNAGNWSDYSDPATTLRINRPPSAPTQLTPANSSTINYNPIFQATVSDPDGDNVKAYFEFSGGSHVPFWGSLVASGGTSQITVTDFADGTYQWRAKTQDAYGMESSYTGYWSFTLNKSLPPPNISEWAWSENIGWISFNCTNQGSCAASPYGVNIESDGDITGYAWSENAGWIDFNPAGPYPSAPDYSAELDLVTNQASGWARALGTDGSWDGWIKLAGANYNVYREYCELKGFAWAGDVIGWISFNSRNCDSDGNGVTDTGNYSQCPAGQSVASYKVSTALCSNRPPSPPGLTVTQHDSATYCTAPSHYFSWTYSDPDGDAESQFQFQVDNNSDFLSPEVNRTYSGLSNSSPSTNNQTVSVVESPGADQIGYNTTYNWRVKVWDNQGGGSGWVTGALFTTAPHRYPKVESNPTYGFSWSPDAPPILEEVQFADQSTVYGGATKSAWSWVFPDATPNTSTQQNPTAIFNAEGLKTVSLQATDSDSFSCSASQTVNVEMALPSQWKEIKPF